MKKQLILFISAMLCLASFAYDYQTFYSHRTCYYENGTGIIAAMKIDSVKFDGDSILYPMKQIRMNADYCYDADGASWIGTEIRITPTWNYFRNKLNQSIRIKTDARLNENWEFFNDGETTIIATVISYIEEKVLSTPDTVKTIRLEVWDRTMKPMPHFLQGKTLKISKKHGLTEVFNLYELPQFTDAQFQLYKLAGTTAPNLGIRNLTWFEVFDFEPGDELHTKRSLLQTMAGPPIEITKLTIKKFLSRNDYTDSIGYIVSESNEDYFKYEGKTELYSKTTNEYSLTIRRNPYFDYIPAKPFLLQENLISNYMKQDGFIRKGTTGIPMNKTLNCFTYHTDEISDVCYIEVSEYYKGLGGPYFEYISGCWEIEKSIDTHKIVYYKKGETSWGTPHIINSLAPQTDTTPRLHIFPNPANEHINVKGFAAQGNLTFKIINLQGISVHNGAINDNNATIQVSTLAGGLYFISIFLDDVCIGSGRFMKQ
jgi:hypothetical protein